MTADQWIDYAKRLIADQAIRILALTDELEAAKQALGLDISEALGREATVDGTVVRAVEP